jgi:hypothetical protein
LVIALLPSRRRTSGEVISMSDTLEIATRHGELADARTPSGALRWFSLVLGVFAINLVVVALACLALGALN